MLGIVALGLAAVAISSAAIAEPARKATAKTRAKPRPAATAKLPTLTVSETPPPAPAPAPSGTDPEPIGNIADWFPADSYPPQARALGLEGRVVFALDIDALGRITQCHVIEGSGSDLLDSATCTQAIINGRFRPGRDAAGKPVAKSWRSTMRWKLAVGAAPGDE
ncbi:MAG: energy transducer TonB [Sphingomonas sp.]|nr:energy transducer TonB [Sphingomonas sp.]